MHNLKLVENTIGTSLKKLGTRSGKPLLQWEAESTSDWSKPRPIERRESGHLSGSGCQSHVPFNPSRVGHVWRRRQIRMSDFTEKEVLEQVSPLLQQELNTVVHRTMTSCQPDEHCVLGFDEFGFAVFPRPCDRWQLQLRSHDYSYPRISTSKTQLWQEMLSNWNEASDSYASKVHSFIESGVPSELRGQLWKCLLGSDRVKESSTHTYQDYVQDLRSQLATLGVNEYGIQMAVSTLDSADNTRGGMDGGTRTLAPDPNSEVKVETLRQIVLDVDRSFPTHCSLMGRNPEAKEGQAKLLRILSAYAKYNPQIGYCQGNEGASSKKLLFVTNTFQEFEEFSFDNFAVGMSYIAAMLLMNMQEDDAFWALVVLVEQNKYLAGFYEHSLDTIQRHAKIFQQLLKHRMPHLWQHMENLKVAPLLFITTWFLTLFTSLPCWDTVLAIWDLIILDGINIIFSTGLCILQLLEPRLLAMSDVSHLLPTLLRIPVDVSRYSILVPALWMTKVHKWELDCMQSVVLEEEEEAMWSSGT